MDLGFETIGNATLILHDRVPVLVTDPWVEGDPFLGSWGHSHEIPDEQRQAIKAARYVWFSHGHPDHLNGDSLPAFRGRPILIPAHVGGRIGRDLLAEGYDVHVLPVGSWKRLSDRIRVLCLPDYNQDAALLVEIGGRLIVNANDSNALGWMSFIRSQARRYERSFLLQLSGYGDPEMINFHDESGNRITPPAMKRKQADEPTGPAAVRLCRLYGTTDFVPFSSMHRYQREDSVWANDCTTPIEAHARGAESDRCTVLPAYVRFDLASGAYEAISPRPAEPVVRAPSEFGDDWSEELEPEEFELAKRYFQAVEHLSTVVDYINLRVGGRDNVIPIASAGFDRGVTFEAPRGSLVTTLTHEIFDDLLVGNFVKTTLHGRWPASGLYPDFTPYVSKYSDNAGARTRDELRAYFSEYRRVTGGFSFLRHRVATRAAQTFRSKVSMDTPLYRLAKRAYHYTGQQRG